MPRYSISIANRQRTLRIDRRAATALARRVLELEQVVTAEISIAFVDDADIHAVNRRFLNHDFPTDVISFLLDGGDSPARPLAARDAQPPATSRQSASRGPATTRRGAGKSIDGEIVISADTALRNAAELGTTPKHELALYLVHGLLHLCGYDDLTPAEKRLMRRREAEVLKKQDHK